MSRTLVARCTNVNEWDQTPCPGTIRYRWGQIQAACDTCGGYCGVAVAKWERVETEDDTTETLAVSRPSDSLLAVEIAARQLFRAIVHEHDERDETFPVRVSLCTNALREALGEEYPK